MKVLDIIVGLNVGGAEMMLNRLVHHDQANGNCQHVVVSLTDLGKLGDQIRAEGIPVYILRLRGGFGAALGLWRLARLIRAIQPDVVQTWMYHADLLGGLASRLGGVPNVVWGIRNTLIPQGRWSRSHFVVRLCAAASRWIPRKIVCCAESARQTHLALGYSAAKMVVIPNGYDLSATRATPELRLEIRRRLKIGCDVVVIGTVGRFDPLKDYRNFIDAAAAVAAERPDVRFMMVGRGLDLANVQLMGLLDERKLADHFILLGERSDAVSLMSAMDVYCLSSRAEGFPNSVAEAMAMHVPCVVTNVGDAAMIVGDAGHVVPPQNSDLLADALLAMVNMSGAQRLEMGVRARQIIEHSFLIENVARQYQTLYSSLRINDEV